MVLASDRTAATLEALIPLPAWYTHIISDGWAANQNIGNLVMEFSNIP